ncbi:MAG: SDR family NAD(P)-dependent oxidoreductase [Planctomycetota bacterium]|jgi:NAD(P)-dependent dehydrogenase (short-subunit alcohol dehydrogenase family)
MDFSGKCVLVTGGSNGIGRAIVKAFADRGARVAINYLRDEKAARDLQATLPGGPHPILQADVSDPEAVKSMVDRAREEMGGLDIVVNNAGISDCHPMEKTDYNGWQEIWRRTLSINLIGAANVSYCAGQHMIQQGGCRIVNVSSRGAFRGEPDKPAYGASKAGLNAMSQSMAQALAHHNIFVGVVAPGFVETRMAEKVLSGPKGDAIRNQSPLGRVARPAEVARAVLFLASEGSEFMTGAIIDVNGASYLRS